MKCHVQRTVTWGTAPSLKALPSGATVNLIHRNPVDYMTAPRPAVAGHISVAAGTADALKTIDVTEAVGCTSSPLSTLISSLTGPLQAFAYLSLGAILPGLLRFAALLCEKSCQCSSLQACSAVPEAVTPSTSRLCSGRPIP